MQQPIDYVALVAEHAVTAATWDQFVRAALIDRWISEYQAATDWKAEVLEINQGDLTFLFDAAPTLREQRRGDGDDRVVAVWGRSALPARRRDRARIAGFLPSPLSWSGAGRDRGHFVAHAAGGGVDLNLFPQAVGLNRGRTEQGRRWRSVTQQPIPGRRCLCGPCTSEMVGCPQKSSTRSCRVGACGSSGSQTAEEGTQGPAPIGAGPCVP